MKRQEITNALRRFGERSHNIVINDKGSTAIVFVNRKYFGIYDFIRKTFVD